MSPIFRRPRKRFFPLIALLIFLACLPLADAAGPGGHGCRSDNLLPNCNMENFVPVSWGQVPSGWQPYVLSGGLTYDPSIDTFWGAPSLRMWSDGGTFVAGVFYQVGGLTPGITYRASMGWGAPTEPDAFGRRLGIDPTGGTDPNSPNIVWGPTVRGPGTVMNDTNGTNPKHHNIDVTALAKGATVTVFVWVDHNYSTGANLIFIDAVGLYADSTVPVAVEPPTSTPAPVQVQVAPPPTSVPQRVAPAKPSATPTATATSTATATPTATSTPSPTHTSTITPTATNTSTPSATPTSTLPPRPQATGTPVQQVRSATVARPPGLLFSGLCALVAATVLGVIALRLRRTR